MINKSDVRKLRGLGKRVPGLQFVYHKYLKLRYMLVGLFLRSKSTEKIFADIYAGNKWGGECSVSGPGSELTQTEAISEALPSILHDLDILTVLDIPCGDFHWMKHVDLKGIDYTGADIVPNLIHYNRTKYESENVKFLVANLINDKLLKVDLVLCRDCLVHLSFKDIFLALHNVCDSGSKYLLTTTYTHRKYNQDIATGQWRALNLKAAPFMLPEPLKTISEHSTEGNGAHKDKALALWKISDIEMGFNTPIT